MMDLDEELTLRIKAVFDNYDDGESDMGWAQLRTKYPEPARYKFQLYGIIGIAASLLLAVSVWFFNNQRPAENEQAAVIKSQKNIPLKKKSLLPSNNGQAPEKPVINAGDLPKNNAENLAQQPIIAKISPKVTKENIGIAEKTNSITTSMMPSPKGLQIKEQQNVLVPLNPMQIATTTTKVETKIDGSTASQINVGQPLARASVTPLDTAKSDQQVVKAVNPNEKKTTAEFLKEESKLTSKKPVQKEKIDKSRKNSYEVFTGTFLNYYGDNDVNVNAGFGLNANLKVAKSLILSIGAGVSQNKISYQAYEPNTPKSSSTNLSFNTATNKAGLAASITTEAVTNTKLNAQLLSLDLPVTLKFYPTKKQNFYIATGFNSNSYFAQKYDYTYTVTTTSSLSSSSRINQGETEKSKFSGFDFANSAIFAIGVNQKIGKTKILIFEPYFKPAIGHMGDKNLKINTAGINLRFRFNKTEQR